MSPVDLSLVDMLGYVRRSSMFVCFQVGSLRSTVLFIDGGCCLVNKLDINIEYVLEHVLELDYLLIV